MRIYKCDHCGKFIKWSNLHRIEMYPFQLFNVSKHLCDECYRILCEWLKDPLADELRELFNDTKAKEESE